MSEPGDAPAPIPVPGFERLMWREPLEIPVTGSNHMPELLAQGDDVGLFFGGGPTSIAELSSLVIERPFEAWPPRHGTPAVHTPRELANSPFRVAPWQDGEVVFLLDEPFAVRCGVPGVRSLGIDVVRRDAHGRPTGPRMSSARPFVGATPEHGIYFVWSRRTEYDGPLTYSLEHRPAGQLDVVQQLGDLPESPYHPVVLDDGSFVFATMHPPAGVTVPKRRRPEDPPIYYETELHQVVEGKLTSRGRLPAPPQSNLRTIVPARGGGAWTLFFGPNVEAVLRIDASCRAVGDAWHAPFPRPNRTRLARWRDGFMLATDRRGVAVLASDGGHTTRVPHAPPGNPLGYDHLAALASPDGRSVLIAHSSRGHIQILRADFEVASASDIATAADVWADDRAASIRAAEAAAARAKRPKRLPGRAVEPESEEPASPSHAKERIVSQIRMRHALRAISGLHFGEFSRFRGDATAGTFYDDDGCGNFNAFAWSTEGLIGVGFDHEMNPDAGAEESELEPEKYFHDLPPALQPLLDALLPSVRRHATGGLWVTTGDGARWQEEGAFPDDFARYTMLPEASVFEALGGQSWLELTSVSEAQARLAIRVAAAASTGTSEVGPEDEAILLAAPAGEREVDERQLLAAVRALAAVSVTWKAGETLAAERIAARQAVALDALGEPQVALLRAANDGDAAAVAALLERGADPRCVAFEGMFDRLVEQVRYQSSMTPLALATLRGHAAVVDLLLEKVGPGSSDEAGEPWAGAVRIAAIQGDAVLLDRLLARIPHDLSLLITLGVMDTAGSGPRGSQPSIDVLRMLLTRGAVPRRRLHEKVVELLEKAGETALAEQLRTTAPKDERPGRRR